MTDTIPPVEDTGVTDEEIAGALEELVVNIRNDDATFTRFWSGITDSDGDKLECTQHVTFELSAADYYGDPQVEEP